MSFKRLISLLVMCPLAVFLFVSAALAQETTGGLQGTVTDPSGAVVSGATVAVTGSALIGNKTQSTDSKGYYRFANIPPGEYTVTVSMKGFKTLKRGGLTIEVGHLPSLDLKLEIGGSETVVEVSGEAPVIDVTTTRTSTNITQDVIQDVPHGRSFQSVIQFAPSARNEPLEGNNTGSNGSGGNAPGSTTNGSDHGFSVGGGSDAENSYLVEGQETANLIGGYSHTNVPFDFIQEVQVKSSGIEAEHGGALGGVVNVVMRKGTNAYHGSVFFQFENNGMDGGPQARTRYDPQGNFLTPADTGITAFQDTPSQHLQPRRDKTSDVFPGFTFGGPILKDRIFGFVGFTPEWNDDERFVNFGPANGGVLPFSQNTQTYYTTARVDASVTQKIRVFGSWLYQYQRQTGVNLPRADSVDGLFNADSGCNGFTNLTLDCSGTPPSAFSHTIGWTAPNVTANFGADVTITPRLVFTTRFGYYFENYHDFGYPTAGTLNIWQNNGVGINDLDGNPIPANSQVSHTSGFANDAFSGTYTVQNANKALQYDADVAWFKSGWYGTHNFKFGYQLNRLQNKILQHYNEPYVQVFPGSEGVYDPGSQLGFNNCANTSHPIRDPDTNEITGCAGLYGTIGVFDFGTGGDVTSFNHGLFAQDAWTIGHGVTINAGIRFDKEYLPASSNAGLPTNPIDFSWGDKVAPRIGAAWDVFKDGKMKVFGSYGKFFDIMKLNVAISSFGGQFWNTCTYALDTQNIASITPALDAAGRYCVGSTGTGAVWPGGTQPAGLTFIENVNFRTFPTSCSTCSLTSTGVTPGLKPYEQHESVFGVDYQIAKSLAFEARWDRRRLDHVIEDSSIFCTVGDCQGSETFVIGNPGQGTEKTFNSFYNFLYPTTPAPACSGTSCPIQQMIPAARSYDGVEFRLTKTRSDHWFGMFSYTYSKLRGNYTGLTSSDISDGQAGGRSSPNNSRAFDEPYFSFNSSGGSSSGLLPTDRPSTFKGYAYYELGWMKKFTTDFGIFQYLYSGSPITSYLDVGAGNGGWAVQAWDRGQYVNVTRDPATGFLTVGAPETKRTPWYTQSDFNFTQNYKLGEQKVISFSAIFGNLFNQRSVTAYNADITSLAVTNQYITTPSAACGVSFVGQCRIVDGNFFYAAAERPYNVQTQLNNQKGSGNSAALSSLYNQPVYYQLSRTIRMGLKFTF